MTNSIVYFLSPLGWLELTASDEALIKVHFMKGDAAKQPNNTENEILKITQKQLTEFFAGERKEFEIPLNPAGTEFQVKVWDVLQKIPFGKTISYLQLAQKVGSKEHTRAVGLANGKNPIAIIIPCHRVIGADGKLTGYAGGMKRKQWLLEFESQQGKLF
jgi:methylated-DNA-[protein]-cysteine S-methyltransferase